MHLHALATLEAYHPLVERHLLTGLPKLHGFSTEDIVKVTDFLESILRVGRIGTLKERTDGTKS